MILSLFRLWRNYPRTSGNESVGLAPDHFHYGGTAADRAGLFRRGGPRQDHPGGRRRALLHDALVLFPPAPGGNGEPDRGVEEAHHRIERIESHRMRLAAFAVPGEERRLDLFARPRA